MKTLQSLATGVSDAAKSSTAVAAVGSAAGAAKERLGTSARTLSAPVSAAAASAYSKATERFDQVRTQYKALLSAWLKRKLQIHTERLIGRLPEMLKDWLDDEDMPRCVARSKDRVVDAFWPDFREEIMWEVALLLDKEKQNQPMDNISGPDCFRRFFRYHIHPCDKSFWGKMWDPIYVGFFLFSCLPVSAASPVAFLFLFLIIDKSDEYQLIYFILWFKGMQFFSHGVLRTIMGFFMYFACVTLPKQPDEHGCENLGPGLAGNFYVILSGWILQVVLVWTAWALLPCSSDKGRSVLKGRITHTKTGVNRMGGYLTRFLFYDLTCFLILCAVLVAVFMISNQGKPNDWHVAHALFACQVIYGFLSMPFFFFTLPVFQSVLTHCIPTAYDGRGRCVRWTGKPRVKKDKGKKVKHSGTEEESNGNNAQELVSTEETSSLLEKMKILFSGGTVELDVTDQVQNGQRQQPKSAEPVAVGGVILDEQS
mmetsp:Transcript_54217/g.126183  ORF Transcript_54217/g.126183 Transcript_54217/m.126183 type:complete len:483 (+) Transcript_54217:69-1517(+)|eukprot:CAMPEP_0171074138 /NCGR_PEP_ID=MMETSP0766_2-20121228/11950_1 /TAXON_ID=439317 /ORGANISM="Gambierdiscus australes, Strain CAWD 149" /LENGTH=482 /DNA_ID=CAMNT_0011530899 /DNA_START=66 /DNA_END=1514 /DNA_ORIENTATION=+